MPLVLLGRAICDAAGKSQGAGPFVALVRLGAPLPVRAASGSESVRCVAARRFRLRSERRVVTLLMHFCDAWAAWEDRDCTVAAGPGAPAWSPFQHHQTDAAALGARDERSCLCCLCEPPSASQAPAPEAELVRRSSVPRRTFLSRLYAMDPAEIDRAAGLRRATFRWDSTKPRFPRKTVQRIRHDFPPSVD
eukprot:scaffold7469_cov172-Pinguiococcus_pyrenoidosus.AAC.1